MTEETTNEEERKTLRPRQLCEQCRSNLIHGAKFKQKDPWMALEIASLLTLINMALTDNKYLIKYGNDVMGVNQIYCLGCFLPEKFKKIIKVAKDTRSIKAVKALGETNEK